MPRRPRYTGPAMTLGNMRANGVRRLCVTCLTCHHEAVVDVDAYPDDLSVPWFDDKLVCTACGTARPNVMPNWVDRPKTESLTGTQYGEPQP